MAAFLQISEHLGDGGDGRLGGGEGGWGVRGGQQEACDNAIIGVRHGGVLSVGIREERRREGRSWRLGLGFVDKAMSITGSR